MSANYYELLKYAATGIASPDMTYYDKLRASTLMGGATVQTLTGHPPLSFKSDGSLLISWSMKGNGVQSGTPTPDNPVMPEFVGARTANLFDNQSLANGYINSSGNVASAGSTKHTDYIPVDAGSTYTLTTEIKIGIGHYLAIYNAEKSKIGNTVDIRNLTTVTVNIPENGAFVRFSMQSGDITKTTMFNKGSALSYEPYGYKIPITCAGQTVPVYLGQVSTVRKIRKLVLDGTETFGYANSCLTFSFDGQPASVKPKNEIIICDRYSGVKPRYRDQLLNNQCCKTINFNQIAIRDNNFTTIEEWKSYLSAQYAAGTPVTIWYVLAEPTTGIVNEPLAKIGTYADELHSEDAAVTIPTVKGANVLTVDTELQPSEMSITYKG